MGETAAALATGTPFEFAGKAYTASPRTLAMEGLFEVWCEKQALDLVRRHQPDMTPSEYESQMDGWRRDGAAQIYTWGSPFVHTARFSTPGLRYMAWLQLVKNNADVTQEWVDSVRADRGKWKELATIVLEGDRPNAQAPPSSKAA